MSGKRIVVETPCEHGNYWLDCQTLLCVNYNHIHSLADGCFCYGGTRRTLTEGQYVLIEKTDGRWPDWAKQTAGIRFQDGRQSHLLLDALSDHTEGTP